MGWLSGGAIMTVVNNSRVLIKNLDGEAYNLGSVTNNPRAASAADIKAGLDNLVVEPSEGTNELVIAVVQYLFQDYFLYAHQSGLYNRQIRLWEMFSRISAVEVRQLERGFFTRTTLPVYEMVMKTGLGQSPICALVIDQSITDFEPYKSHKSASAGKIYLELLKDFLLKVMKIQARLGANGVKGIFVVTPEPLEAELLAFIEKATGATDPVSKVESIMPAPVSAHINLLTYSQAVDDEGASLSEPVITMAHPKISRKTVAPNLS
jgi:hypothetical protein